MDTTSEHGSIALAAGAELIEELPVAAPDGFGHILFPAIEALLSRHGVTLQQIGCFAAAAGPGSFTGVRVGLTAVKGFADATGARVVGVSNLQALAWFGEGDLRAPWIDARRGEVYGAVYNSRLKLVQAEVVKPYRDWSAALPPGAVEIATRPPLAQAIAAIAWQCYATGQTPDAAEIDANYVRRSDAELMWREV